MKIHGWQSKKSRTTYSKKIKNNNKSVKVKLYDFKCVHHCSANTRNDIFCCPIRDKDNFFQVNLISNNTHRGLNYRYSNILSSAKKVIIEFVMHKKKKITILSNLK
jgi:hypothetical protein